MYRKETAREGLRAVRIEELKVSGLRSHRGDPPTSLTLTGKRFVAVVGHTGAGKSSLLEAITFALFGEATYGGKAYEELSSDGRSEMTVQLTFTRGGEHYQLLRTVAPDRYGKFGNKVVYLRQVDEDGNILRHVERVRDVDKAVSALLGGMGREQFCQAVLLAQNRFAALLEANPADRERLLDTLLGLNALGEARTALQKTRNAAGRNIDRLEDRRRNLPADPAAEASAAKARAKAMGGVAKRAEECGSKLGTLADEATVLSQQANDLERFAALRTTERGRSGPERLAEISRTLESLAHLEGELSTAEKKAAADLEEARRVVKKATGALGEAEAHHGASGRHQVVGPQIDTLASLLAEKPKLALEVSAAEADVERIGVEMADAQAEATATKAEAERRLELNTEAQGAAQQAITATERAEQALSSVVSAAGRLTDHSDAVEQASGALDVAQAELTEADEALAPLAARRAEVELALEAEIRSESAAAASHGCHPGDDCPVCGRVLLETWVAPAAVGLDAARERVVNADALLRKAADRQRRAREAHVEASTRLRSSLGGVAVTFEEISTLATNRELPAPPAPAAVLSPPETDDDGVMELAVRAAIGLREALAEWIEDLSARLGPLHKAKEEAETRLKETADELIIARTAETQAADAVGLATTELAAANARHKAARDAVGSCEERLSATLLRIDKRWQTLIDLESSDSVERARHTLAEDQTVVTAAAQCLDEAQTAVGTQEKAVQDLVARRSRELTAPLSNARTELCQTTELVNDLCARIELPATPAVSEDAGARELLGVVSDLVNVANRAAATARERCTALRGSVEELAVPATEVVSLLASLMSEADPGGKAFGVKPDPADPLSGSTRQLVQQVIGGARHLASEAGVQADAADKAVKAADDLDERLLALRSWRADLDGAIDVLKKEHFPRWARGLKMADLVETASEHLSQMTDSRYRFDPALQISDEVAGVVRKASTLSGGEKFEASLALALGVSEIAGRSGVRIETLFLDEGFAGLDQTHLNRALDALEGEVEAGRSIVIITHIGAVADRIQDVLLIQPDGAGGSTTKWLDEDERFELGADLDLAVP